MLVRACVLCAALALPGAATFPQQLPPPPQDPYRIRVERQLVLVDVVVRARRGEMPRDLTAADFTITEDGKPQEMAFFSFGADRPSTPAVGDGAATAPPAAADRGQQQAAPVVVLLDGINSKPEDRAHSRRALEQILARLEPGQRVAIYGLGRELVLLHGFSSDPDSLLRALQLYQAAPSQRKADVGAADHLEWVAEVGLKTDLDAAIQGLRRFETQIESDMLRFRGELTAAALRSIARSLRALPGRKSLIWLSGSFPSQIVPAPKLGEDGLQGVVRLDADMLAAAAELNDAQVAVYPVHAAGLMAMQETDISRPHMRNMRVQMEREHARRDAVHDDLATLKNLADRTGGAAFFNRNDLTLAYDAALADGAAYYTLGYYPSNDDWNGRFRRIRVNVTRSGVNLRHRQGYFALSPEQRRSGAYAERELSDAIFVNPATLDELVFTATLLPAARDERGAEWTQVSFLVHAASLQREQAAEATAEVTAKLTLEFAAALFDRNGNLVTNSQRSVAVSFEPERAARTRITHQLPLAAVPQSGQRIRALVRDPGTGRIGTLDILVP